MQFLRRFFNVLSLLGGILLLVAMSWEILTGASTHFSPTYLWIQLFVCLVFMADFFIRMAVDEHKGRFFVHNFWFLLISIPYMNIIAWTGADVPRQWSILIIAVPLLRIVLRLHGVVDHVLGTNAVAPSRVATLHDLRVGVVHFPALLPGRRRDEDESYRADI